KAILIVDDEPSVIHMISQYLTAEGYNTLSATTGRDALKIAETESPFAITLDISMPDMDGWEILQNLKKDPTTADIPVIIVSVSQDRTTGFALGAVGFITKPFSGNALIAEINQIGSQPHSIMVVDDNEIDLKQTASVIEAEGIEALCAESGSICMEMLKAQLPDVVVLDLMMPEMDGFEVLDKIRMNPETRSLPVIIVSAKDLTAEERKRLEGSVSSILSKSDTSSNALLEEIRKILLKIERREGSKGRGSVKGNRILLVEDNESSVIQVKHTLEAEGFTVDVARDGAEALEYVKETIPDGIILDLMMPGVDGFDVLDEIRNTEATLGVPVLILTAKDLTADDLGRLRSNNVQELVQKGDVDREGLLLKTKTMMGLVPVPVQKAGSSESKGARPAPVERRGEPTILIVEDNPDNLITIKAILGGRYAVREAADGETGLEMALAELPDLVLLDMSLPGMDGFEVVRRIKADEKVGHIPVIALTAKAMKGDKEKIMEAGCDDYISKPVDPEKILKKIAARIGKGPKGEGQLT
ncbi:MAG: response regulator, partial [Desulfobacterales bacterium]